MNNDRRKRIQAVIKALEGLVVPDLDLESLKDEVEDIEGDEQDYYDTMPESLQSGDRGSRAQEAIDFLGEARGALEELIGALGKIEEITGNLENAENVR